MKDGPIIPGIGISSIRLGMSRQELLCLIGDDYQEQCLEMGSIIKIENAKFWISSDGKVDQIGVENDFRGKYKKLIGLGSTLVELKKYVGDYIEVQDTYELKDIKGICFELEDIDDWDELKAPIDHIYVFRVWRKTHGRSMGIYHNK